MALVLESMRTAEDVFGGQFWFVAVRAGVVLDACHEFVLVVSGDGGLAREPEWQGL